MVEKPDYVLNFVRPANTEIKYIRGHWYLYERSNVYDPRLGRSRKKSGKILGSITEQGLVPSRARRECVNPVLNDVVEVGAVNYIYQRTEWMRSRLQKYFLTCGNIFMRHRSSAPYMTAASDGCSSIMKTAFYRISIRGFPSCQMLLLSS